MNRVGDSLWHFHPNEALINAFLLCGVEFILVGGLAVAWYCPERQAKDMDLLINPTPSSSSRAVRALATLGYRDLPDDSFAKPNVQAPSKHGHYAGILTQKTEGPACDDVAGDAVDGKVFSMRVRVRVRVASAACLIRMKRIALADPVPDRDKHLRDTENLNQHAA